MRSLYDILGLPKTASAADIKAAYRKLAQQNHPDKGGDKELFQQVQTAYDVLGDEARRAAYDETGRISGQGPTLRDRAMSTILVVMDKVLEQCSVEHDNLVDVAAESIGDAIKQLNAKRETLTKNRDKVVAAMKRTRAKDGEQESLAQVLAHIEAKFAVPLAATVADIEQCEEAVRILREHDYQVDERPAPKMQPSSAWGTNPMANAARMFTS